MITRSKNHHHIHAQQLKSNWKKGILWFLLVLLASLLAAFNTQIFFASQQHTDTTDCPPSQLIWIIRVSPFDFMFMYSAVHKTINKSTVYTTERYIHLKFLISFFRSFCFMCSSLVSSPISHIRYIFGSCERKKTEIEKRREKRPVF